MFSEIIEDSTKKDEISRMQHSCSIELSDIGEKIAIFP